MRVTRVAAGGSATSLDLLAARARRGDRRATAALHRRMTPQVRQLAFVLAADARTVPGVVRQALVDAVADTDRPYTVAAVAAVQRRAAAARGRAGASSERPAAERLQQAVSVLCDVQGHSHSSAAALLGQPVDDVAALHDAARAGVGLDGPREHCRGWHLVSRMDDLTPPEQSAGDRHLTVCRVCRDGLAARAAARRRLKAALPVGGTVVGGGIAALLSTFGGGSLAAGTAAVGAAAVLGTAGLVAIAPPAAMTAERPSSMSVSVSAVTSPAEPRPAPGTTANPAPSAPDVVVPGSDRGAAGGPVGGATPVPAASPADRPQTPAESPTPTSVPLPTPLPLPPSRPLPALPVPTPTGAPLPLPTPTGAPLPLPTLPLPSLSVPTPTPTALPSLPAPTPTPLPSLPAPTPTLTPLPVPSLPVPTLTPLPVPSLPVPTLTPVPEPSSPLPLPVPLPTGDPLPLPSSPVPALTPLPEPSSPLPLPVPLPVPASPLPTLAPLAEPALPLSALASTGLRWASAASRPALWSGKLVRLSLSTATETTQTSCSPSWLPSWITTRRSTLS